MYGGLVGSPAAFLRMAARSSRESALQSFCAHFDKRPVDLDAFLDVRPENLQHYVLAGLALVAVALEPVLHLIRLVVVAAVIGGGNE